MMNLVSFPGPSLPLSEGPVCVETIMPIRACSAGSTLRMQRVNGIQRSVFARPTEIYPTETSMDGIALLNPLSPQRFLSPCTAHDKGVTSEMDEDAARAESAYRKYGRQPSQLSPTSALDLIAIADAKNSPGLHGVAFHQLIKAFSEQRDTLPEYCLAMLQAARVGTFNFLSCAQNEDLQELSSKATDAQDENLAPWLRLSYEELVQLYNVLQSRGMGPVLGRYLDPGFSNYHWVGPWMTKQTARGTMTLRAVLPKDIYALVNHCKQLKNGILRPNAVMHALQYETRITAIEISSNLLALKITVDQKDITVKEFIEQLRKANPLLPIIYDPQDFPGRHEEKQLKKISYY